MSGLRFRNVDAQVSDDVGAWPYEAVATALDRGLVSDWQPLFAELRRAPWGPVARRIERLLSERDDDAVTTLFSLAVRRARSDTEAHERHVVSGRIRDAVTRSGLTQAEFAERVGTSASRLSTYLSGTVTPSATMLVRIESWLAADDSSSQPGETWTVFLDPAGHPFCISTAP